MPEIVVDCPSGLQGRVRGLKARELNLLSDRKSVRSGEVLDRILRACWTETLNKGPYTFEGDPDWETLLQCDRFTALIKIRVATYPDEPYPFDVMCQNAACGSKIEWEVDLDKDLPVRPLPAQSIEHVAKGTFFETLVGGKKVQWALQTGKEEKKATKRKTQITLTQALTLRIRQVDDVIDPRLIERWLQDQEMAECRKLMQEFEEADGGIDTTVDVECQSCLVEQDVDLPFSEEFFMPRVDRKKTSKKKTTKKGLSTQSA
jgi:hypothetical protein